MRHFITFKGINNGADLALDVSAICNSIDTEIHDPRCTKEAKSAAGTAAFAIRWTPDKVTDPYNGNLIDRPALYQTVIDAMLYSIENKAEMEVIIRDDSLQNICFRGYIDPSDVSLSRTKIPQKISVSCKDHTTDLDKKIGYNIVREGLSVNEIVEELLELCYGNGSHILVGTGEDEVVGTGSSGNSIVLGVKRVISALPDSVIVDRFVVTADENTTYRQHIDKLLLEKAGGYVLHYVHATNKFEVVPCIPEEVDDSEIRFISFMSNEQVVTRTGVYSHDGILLKWPTIEERVNDNVYSEDITLSYVQGLGAVGAIVQQGAYYPSKGDVTATKQQFRRSDREYVTGVSRTQNSDIDLLYAKDAQLGIVADPVSMTNKGTVQNLDELEALDNPELGWYARVLDIDGRTEYRGYNGSAWEYMDEPSLSDGKGNTYKDKGSVPSKSALPLNPSVGDFYLCDDTQITWCWMDGQWQRKISLFCFPILNTPDVNMEDGNPAFYPRSMWALGRNRSGGMVNLKAMSVTAKSVARTKVNKTTYPAVIKDPDEYDASYITDKTEAENFALFLYNFHRIACTTCTWYEWEGQRTPLSRLGERVRVEYMTGSEAVFCVIQLDYSAVTRKSRKIKVTALLVSGFTSSFTGLHETEVAPQLVNRRQAVSQEINYANATNGTTIPETGWSTTRTIEKGKYLWTRYTTTYSDSTTETTYSVVYNPDDAEMFDFSFAVETFYRNKRLAQNQEIPLTIDIQGLTGYVLSFNAYADDVLDNTLLDSTSNPSKLIIPMNNNYSKVKVIMSASPSSMHVPVTHEISVIDITDKDHDFGAWQPQTIDGISYILPDHFVGSDGNWYGILKGDYFVAEITFGTALWTRAMPAPTDNPQALGYYERTGTGTDADPYVYFRTTDTTVDPDARYYYNYGDVYDKGVPYIYADPIADSWHNAMTATTANAGRMLHCLGTVLNDPNIQPSVGALYGWFANLVALNAVIENLVAKYLQVGFGDGTSGSGFRFRALNNDGNGVPVFDVYYGDKRVFQIDVTSGDIFFGGGLIYHAATDTIEANSAVFNGIQINNANGGEANFGSAVFKQEGSTVVSLSITSTGSQGRTIYDWILTTFNIQGPTGVVSGWYSQYFPCTCSRNANVKFMRAYRQNTSQYGYNVNKYAAYFYDSNYSLISSLNAERYETSQTDKNPFSVGDTISTMTGGNIMKLVDLPTSSAGLSSGRVWRDVNSGNVLKIVP